MSENSQREAVAGGRERHRRGTVLAGRVRQATVRATAVRHRPTR
jgi:hypothetical protein